jgi:cyclase
MTIPRSWVRPSVAVCLGTALAVSAWIRPVATQTAPSRAAVSARPPGAEYAGKAFTFNRIAEGVYLAAGTGNLSVVSNAGVIVNDTDVVVVDTHISPAAAWALRDELKTITDKPIRYVVNSHFHLDHAHGNQIYGADVEIIGHEFTRERLLAGDSKRGPAYEALIGRLPGQVRDLQQRSAAASGDERTRLERQLSITGNYLTAAESVVPTPPTVTFPQSLTLYRGTREIRLLFLGRGHTAGDIVVHLPRERVVFTGDLMVGGLSNMSDAYPLEWAATLEKLKGLEFDTLLPGHGAPVTDKARIEYFQAYLRDFWAQAAALHAARVPAADAVMRIDMSAHIPHYGANVNPSITPIAALQRAYAVLDAGTPAGAAPAR